MAYTTDLVSSNLTLLKEYAQASFAETQTYLAELNSFVVSTIETVPPVISISTPTSVTVDPNLSGLVPVAPTGYPDAPDAPTTADHSFPNAPTFTLPDVPTLTDIVIPDFIDMAVSQPTMAMPVMSFDVPDIAQLQDGGLTAEDELVQAAKSKLISNIANGGTMINPQVEADIWNRDLERNERALQDAIDKLTAQWAKLGWSVPDGLLAGSILGVNNEYMNKRLDRSREIAVKQAELEQAGMFKSLEMAIALSKVLIDNMNDYARRVFETSKSTADVAIQIFKTRVERYNALLGAFKTDMERYKIGIDAEIGRASVYKTRVEAQGIIAGIDDTRVKLYTARIGALSQLIDMYKTGVQATATMYEAEKTKIEGYKSQVDAYTSKIEAITKQYGLGVEEFKAYIQAYTVSADVQTKLADLNLKGQVASTEATLKEWETQLKLVQENVTLKMEALKTVAQTASNMVAGALSAMHVGLSQSLSDSASTQTSHIYNY